MRHRRFQSYPKRSDDGTAPSGAEVICRGAIRGALDGELNRRRLTRLLKLEDCSPRHIRGRAIDGAARRMVAGSDLNRYSARPLAPNDHRNAVHPADVHIGGAHLRDLLPLTHVCESAAWHDGSIPDGLALCDGVAASKVQAEKAQHSDERDSGRFGFEGADAIVTRGSHFGTVSCGADGNKRQIKPSLGAEDNMWQPARQLRFGVTRGNSVV